MLRISEMKFSIRGQNSSIKTQIEDKIALKSLRVLNHKIVKESIDARNRNDIKIVYTVDFEIEYKGLTGHEAELMVLKKTRAKNVKRIEYAQYEKVAPGNEELIQRPVIAGYGPCGMFAGLVLAQGGYKPLILERGRNIERRIKDVHRFWEEGVLDSESNVQFGEGGAGTFSDGKLTTQIKDFRIQKVLEELVDSGAPADILYKQKPHVGTDVLRTIVRNIREKIIALGGEVMFDTCVTAIFTEPEGAEKRITGIEINGKNILPVQSFILAPGHSARDTFRMLYKSGVTIQAKPFSVGVRIEHLQNLISKAQYGEDIFDIMGEEAVQARLGAAEYKLSYRCNNGRGVYTFCMCPGGYVVGASSQEGCVVTNGMSYHKRSGKNANSALLVGVDPDDFPGKDPLAGISLQENLERLAFKAGGSDYRAPVQRVSDFMGGKSSTDKISENYPIKEINIYNNEIIPTYKPGVKWGDIASCLPEYAVDALKEALPAMGRKLKGFDAEDAVMTAVETRSSSPVRILRDDEMQSISIRGLYPGGEGAGYAGGIVSAAVDGIKIAEKIIKRFAIPDMLK